MMRVRNWKRHQHFKDRKPPWIKLYRDLLDDVDWHELDDALVKSLVMIWLVASENDGELPDIKKLAFRLRKSESETKSIVSKLGAWLEQDDINPISERYQETRVETETETETEGEGDLRAIAPSPPESPKAASPVTADSPKPARQARKKPAHAMPEGWSVPEEWIEEARQAGHATAQNEARRFVNWAQANGRIYADWKAAWRNWYTRDLPEKPSQTQAPDALERNLLAWLDAGANRAEWGRTTPFVDDPKCPIPREVLVKHKSRIEAAGHRIWQEAA